MIVAQHFRRRAALGMFCYVSSRLAKASSRVFFCCHWICFIHGIFIVFESEEFNTSLKVGKVFIQPAPA